MIRHLVLFKTLPSVSPAQTAEFLAALRDLKDEIPGIIALEAGSDVSGRGTYDVGLSVDFEHRDRLLTYMSHPAHQAVVNDVLPRFVEPHREVVDFEFRSEGPGGVQ